MISTLIDTVPLALSGKKRYERAISDENMHFMQLALGKVRYYMKGNGPTLVIACDPPLSIVSYKALVDCLSDDFCVVVIEQPGFGFSYPKVGYNFSFEQMNSMFYEFLIKLDLAPYVLSLPCVTGYSAVTLANQYPELISRLVMTQTPSWDQLKAWAHARDTKKLLRKPVLGQLLLAALKFHRSKDWFNNCIADQAQAKVIIEQTQGELKMGACFCLASGFQNYLFSDEPSVKPPIQPVLAIWGGNDSTHSDTPDRSTLSVVPHAKWVELKHCGHSPEIEDPAAFADAVRQFVFGG